MTSKDKRIEIDRKRRPRNKRAIFSEVFVGFSSKNTDFSWKIVIILQTERNNNPNI